MHKMYWEPTGLCFFFLALEEDEWRTLFTLDFSGRRTKDATQQEARIPLKFLIFFSSRWIVKCYISIFYFYIQITNYYDPEGDAFQTKTEVLHCIARCF
jgi:hypothetical protein